ncbi:MAG: hypothetical protein V9G11_01405 [Bifidobacterium adolescentis]
MQGNEISSERKLLIEANESDGFDVRAMNGARYERLWDDEVLNEVERHLLPNGWVPAYPTFNIDPATPVDKREKALIRTDRYSFSFYFTEPKFKAGDGFSDQKVSGMQGSAGIAAAQGFRSPEVGRARWSPQGDHGLQRRNRPQELWLADVPVQERLLQLQHLGPLGRPHQACAPHQERSRCL